MVHEGGGGDRGALNIYNYQIFKAQNWIGSCNCITCLIMNQIVWSCVPNFTLAYVKSKITVAQRIWLSLNEPFYRDAKHWKIGCITTWINTQGCGIYHYKENIKQSKIHYITSSGYPNSTHANQYGCMCQYGHGTIEAFPFVGNAWTQVLTGCWAG